MSLSARLEDILSRVSRCGAAHLPPELADELATMAGEAMVELADYRFDRLARQAIEDARRLREVVRTLLPEAARVAEPGRALISDLERVIREDRRAA